MFHKVMFSRSGHGTSAGLVVDTNKIDPADMSAVSRLFPYSEARFMRTYHVSPAFGTFAEAFAYVFPVDIEGNARKPIQDANGVIWR